MGRGAQDTRRTALFDELVPADVEASQVEAVVGKLADARLIITDERDERDIVTIAHEKLIDAWPWLRKLVNENRDAIALQNQIAEDAGEWATNQRDASYLYVGARLANAREQLAAKKIVLSGLAQAFVAAGVEAEGTNRAREAARIQKELDDARKAGRIRKAAGGRASPIGGEIAPQRRVLDRSVGHRVVVGCHRGSVWPSIESECERECHAGRPEGGNCEYGAGRIAASGRVGASGAHAPVDGPKPVGF